MKTSPFIKALFFFQLSQLMAKETPYLLEVKKDTPFFAKPSMASSRLAEAEAGTLLMYVEKSKKGIWVKLRDSTGLEGWMPIDRTDYKEVDVARAGSEQIQQLSASSREFPQEKQKSKEEMMDEIIRSQKNKPFEPFLRIAPLARWLSESEPSASRFGFRIDYNLGTSTAGRNSVRNPAWVAAEATFPSPLVAQKSSDFTAALRYVLRAPLWGPLVYGPDIGYSVDSMKGQYRHHLSMGLGAAVVIGPVDLMLRGAYDFFSQSRAMIEVQLGVSF